MGANFFDHFKNKELKDLFKRLCTQNQQRKFNALWQMLDQLTAEQVKARAAGTSSGQSADAKGFFGEAIFALDSRCTEGEMVIPL